MAKSIKEYWEEATPMNFSAEKWTYEQKRKFRYDLQDYMHDSFQFQDFYGQQVLEVGCGSGIDAVEFARNGALVMATDITDNAIELTRKHAIEAKVGLSLKKCSADGLRFKDEVFDLVYSYGVLHHIPEVKTAMHEIHRVLKPGGVVMAMLYNRDSLLFAYSIMYLHGIKEGKGGYDIATLTRMYSERIEDCPYTRTYTKDSARELFEKWFEDVTVEVRYNVIDTSQQRKVKIEIPEECELGWHLIVKGRKPNNQGGFTIPNEI